MCHHNHYVKMKFTIEVHKEEEIKALERKLESVLTLIHEIESIIENFFNDGEEDPIEVLGMIRGCLHEES